MADHGVAPEEICMAIEDGQYLANVATVRQWLDTGGDANASARYGPPLLLLAAWYGRASIIDLLLSRGADIDATDNHGRTAVYELLNHWMAHRSLPALRVLLSHGADVNLARPTGGFLGGRSPLMIAANEEGTDIIRLLLRAGADPEHRASDGHTAEEEYRQRVLDENVYAGRSADLLRDVRLAGGWVRYALQPHYDLLVLRALCHRGRATFSARTPEVLVRLFGAPAQVRRRTRSAAREGVHVPDPLFWRVLEFSLGPVYDYPWVRERVRARAAAVAAAR
jgi:hypothetical protein